MLVVGMVALAGWVMSGSAWAVITGSAHDFSGATWNSTGRICVVCHTPHNAPSALVPLWNHDTTATTAFTLYSSSTLDAVPGQPEGVSKACLSCHDGTVALNSFGGNENAAGVAYSGSDVKVTGDHDLGTNLSNDHPISFTYDAALATTDGGLATPVSTKAVDAAGEVPLFSSKVECSSCHDVHDAAGNADLLVIANTGSALCLTCHNK